ncbi:hypothetical protein [Coxiella burnetii]|uniref:hypothetical protein n=1 Tax=Coxiella burnetii TaxID=777 RepID=UPI0000ED01FE|nr:hypothetical protein [Coxiella burnetii]ACJ20903.1 hypothetical membrane spanning protein [Coxiella burnetii CbuK_Q154]AIT63983.1 putative membrane spanning protein [Coxiella burnetii str. Namibia]ATN86476.1 hypothetical protein AYO29_08645 [Coxiella burnetii str. Schperling]EAX32682.1 hypothetical protein A35_09030 [Coxiella burnetii 'MSU Goat Q177']EDR35680.1 hypothetical protein COXBURSA334_0371 [Coxiella burnetii Q321]
MIKQFILLILLSLAAIFFRIELSHVLDGLVYIHNYIARTLHLIFSDDPAGRLIQNMISLLIIPVVAGFVVATAFWLIKRMAMPHIMAVIWVLWLILLTTMVAQTHMSPAAVKASARVPVIAVVR